MAQIESDCSSESVTYGETSDTFLDGYATSSLPSMPLERFLPQSAVDRLRYFGLSRLADIVGVPVVTLAMILRADSQVFFAAERWLMRNCGLRSVEKRGLSLASGDVCQNVEDELPITDITTPGVAAKLADSNYRVISDLSRASEGDLLRIKGLGPGHIRKLKSAAASRGIDLVFADNPKAGVRRVCSIEECSFRKAMWRCVDGARADVDTLALGIANSSSCVQAPFRVAEADSHMAYITVDLANCRANLYSLINHNRTLLFASAEQAYRVFRLMSEEARNIFYQVPQKDGSFEKSFEAPSRVVLAN